MRRRISPLVLLALACGVAAPAEARKDPAPYRASIEVGAASGVGEAALREDAAAEVAVDLRRRGCLSSVEPAGSAAGDLRVRVRFEELTSELTYATSLAQSVSPDAPPDVREGGTARVRAVLLVEIAELPGQKPLTERRLTVDVRREPRRAGEDVESFARQEALEQIGERVGAVVCKAAARASRR